MCADAGIQKYKWGAGGPVGWWLGWVEAEESWQVMIEQVPIDELNMGRIC